MSGSDSARSKRRTVSWAEYRRHGYIYLLILPGTLFLLLFHVAPIWGLLLAFNDYNPMLGLFGSRWVGFKNFAELLASQSFFLILRNTIAINVLNLLLFFPAPIVLAILLSEVRSEALKRVTQSIVYLPHFLSWVVVASFTFFLLSTDVGLVNKALKAANVESVSFLQNPHLFWEFSSRRTSGKTRAGAPSFSLPRYRAFLPSCTSRQLSTAPADGGRSSA